MSLIPCSNDEASACATAELSHVEPLPPASPCRDECRCALPPGAILAVPSVDACVELASTTSASHVPSSARDATVPATVGLVERRRTAAPPPPPRRAAPRVSSLPNHLPRRLRPSPLVPHRQTSPRLSGLAYAGTHATADTPRTVTAAGAFAPRLHSQASLGRVAAGLAAAARPVRPFDH
jgi:hypothetical protein